MRESRVLIGFHAVLARLRADPGSMVEILVDESRHDARLGDVLRVAERAGVRVMRVPGKRLDGFYGGGRHQGIVARVEGRDEQASLEDVLERLTEPALLLVLDGVTDPHNLGACLRVADAAGAHAVIVPKDRSAGLSPIVTKVASGAAESVPFLTVTNLARTLDALKERGIWIVGAASEGEQDLYGADLPSPIAWVLGSEGEGLRRLTRERCDLLVRIPMHGQVESLNVSVAAGLCLYESRRRRRTSA
ncbi:MAG TPA: 23S rRNA (guanosine(2251)-2'-O)-methyltransferase RlmB [Burkholderiales bacterium]|nr:23S rRNA (guanosine(2251)-2'-O)-methyltransferase RlmB [Burkholderiales bacterium]